MRVDGINFASKPFFRSSDRAVEYHSRTHMPSDCNNVEVVVSISNLSWRRPNQFSSCISNTSRRPGRHSLEQETKSNTITSWGQRQS
eukprot:767175-Hanusia_phi.AAC.7